MIAEVIFNLPIERAFDYEVPSSLSASLRVGMRVVAPFGRRRLVGYVKALRATSAIKSLKSVLRLIDNTPVLKLESWRLATWLANRYVCSLGEACASIVPTALRIRPASSEPPISSHAPGDSPPIFTAEQHRAFAHLNAAIRDARHQIVLLHGVTGSGKTELYLRAIDEVLRQGRSAVCLVPEIALTPQTIDRFRQRFGSEVVLWHSRLTARQRADQWHRLDTGRSRVVVGTRSAVFAPVTRLGIIILDEEHDPSYKQDETPRYHAREVAIARARYARAVVILGSATPSIESYDAAQKGRYHLLELTQRVEGRVLPEVELIDMRQELARRHRFEPLSGRLQQALRHVVDLREQAILLLNRRGFARVAQCPVCGTTVRCRRCDVPLIYHASPPQLVCHYCDGRQVLPERCPHCGRGYLRLRGTGTERIESELHRLFPATAIGRMDTDTMTRRESHRAIYESIKTHQIDLLVGTQMVAKGWDIPQVTLVGVVSADTALNLPDFRAGEWTFDLLAQVSGRAGRGSRPGRVLIQTFCPSHYAIQAASRHDYQEFYRAEIRMRARLKLPPLTHLIELTVQGTNRQRVQDEAQSLRRAFERTRTSRSIEVLGPAPHRIATLRGRHRWRVVLKGRRIAPLVQLVRRTLGESRRFHGLPVVVDVDPL